MLGLLAVVGHFMVIVIVKVDHLLDSHQLAVVVEIAIISEIVVEAMTIGVPLHLFRGMSHKVAVWAVVVKM
jgi:hypothetical protein